jgi:hypothetical protein
LNLRDINIPSDLTKLVNNTKGSVQAWRTCTGFAIKMPLGWERINVKKSTPNKNIVFIKPRPGPDEKTSQDFLERIAAQCLPIMNKHHLVVASLEEYQPNLEFWGMSTHKVDELIANQFFRSQLQQWRGYTTGLEIAFDRPMAPI